jgi:hypothetical protein
MQMVFCGESTSTGNDASEAAIILRVCGHRGSENFFRSVGNENLSAGNTDTFTSMGRIDLRNVRLEPCPVAGKPFVLSSRFGQLGRISYFFHYNRGMFKGHDT